MTETMPLNESLKIFSTCPPSTDLSSDNYVRRVIEAARWSEDIGCAGILIYTDNSLVDPWLVAQIILQNTDRLCPMIAVQPVYMPPYTAAKMVASYALLHNRRIYLNMVAGGFTNDLQALNDAVPHDERYGRLIDYTLLLIRLLDSRDPVSFESKYYVVRNLQMKPFLPPELRPGLVMSGSSPAGLAAARATGATSIIYPRPAEEKTDAQEASGPLGVRIGIIAREDADAAWRVALERFPGERRGQLKHKLAMAVSDSHWHEQLSQADATPHSSENPYWLWPFQNYKTFCPYLVGSFKRTAEELARYVAKGYQTFILDIPRARSDLETAAVAFRTAMDRAHRLQEEQRESAGQKAVPT
jgi:alkanesulfonate monooxygenase